MMKMKNRFDFGKVIKMQVTLRAKILCIISWISKILIPVPSFEEKARKRKAYKEYYYLSLGKYFAEGIEKRG